MSELRLVALSCPARVAAGDDLAALVLASLAAAGETLAPGDALVVTSKVVAKAEGRAVALEGEELDAKRRLVESESVRILRRRGELVVSETRHGFICANAGVDLSNVEAGTAVLLPVDPDRSARRLRAELRRRLGVEVGVVVSDTFGRAWRRGVTDVAIGCAGVLAVLDLRGTPDATGRLLEATEVCVADELASAAELAAGKAENVPAVVVRGATARVLGDGAVLRDVVRPPAEDLFR